MDEKKPHHNPLMQYAGFAAQLVAGLALGVLLGMWVDKKINIGFPVLIWLFPLVILIGMLIKVVKDTSTKK